MLHSIQTIKHVYTTGDLPVLVECVDLNDYVCKHNRGQIVSYKLFAEWMCHALLADLGVVVPKKELVKIKDEHVLGTSECQIAFFKNTTCFGTLHLKEALEWSQFPIEQEKLITNKQDLLTIAFCDIWLANDDRNFNNFNLLLNPTGDGVEIVPIDHAACFNGLSFSYNCPLTILTEGDSLIFTDEFRNLVKPRLKKMKDVNDFVESLYLCIPKLEESYDEHVLAIPSDWNIPSDYIIDLKNNLFQKEWLIETKTTFLTFIKSSLKLK